VSTHYFRLARPGAASVRGRSPSLERLLARADSVAAVTAWRSDAFRVIAPGVTPVPALAPCVLFAECGPLRAGSVFIATPVHYVADMTSVRLPADGILALSQSQAEALAGDFNRVWKGAGLRMVAGRRADLFCVADEPLAVSTCHPEEVLDERIEHRLPAGTDAPRLRQLMSEIEMWLFDHAVNRLRCADALPVVNGLWLWGGGPALEVLPTVDGWTAGDDPFFSAFAGRPEFTRGVGGVVAAAAEPGTDAWRESESQRLERSVEALRAGEIARLDLSGGDRCLSVTARGSRRFWRRPRPWWEYFE
jgi:hypothetical protein